MPKSPITTADARFPNSLLADFDIFEFASLDFTINCAAIAHAKISIMEMRMKVIPRCALSNNEWYTLIPSF